MGGSGEAVRVLTAGLWALPGPGPRTLEQILEQYPDPSELVERPFERWLPGFALPNQAGDVLAMARALGVRTAAESAARLFNRCRRVRVALAFKDDAAYPALLRSIVRAPALLFFRGPGAAAPPRLRVAMVGTRRPDAGFGRAARALADALARSGLGVVSGAAEGVDEMCHDAALHAHGETWAFLGSSIDQVDPHPRQVVERILKGGGSVFTEFPPGVRADKSTFPRRNRYVSGASDAVVVLRAPPRSGALITAEFAELQGRPLLAMPGDPGIRAAHGSNLLLKEGRALVCLGPGDVMKALGLASDAVVRRPPPLLPEEERERAAQPRSAEAAKVLEALAGNVLDFDALVARTGINPGDLLGTLHQLVMDRAIVRLLGERYGRP